MGLGSECEVTEVSRYSVDHCYSVTTVTVMKQKEQGPIPPSLWVVF